GGAYSGANDINDAGQIVGSTTGTGDDITTHHAFLRNADGSVSDLGLGGVYSIANAINTSGEVVGFTRDLAGDHAFLFDNSSISIISGSALIIAPGEASAINDQGVVAGNFPSGPSFYENGVITQLGGIPGYNKPASYFPNAINSSGQIVGD